MDNTDKEFHLLLVPPEGGKRRIPCDSVRFQIPDGKNGRGGGSVGIRKGHTDALAAVAPGILTATKNGEPVFRAKVGEGIAAVTGDSVTVLAAFEPA